MAGIPEEAFIKMNQDPRLVAMNELIKQYAPYPNYNDKSIIDFNDPETKKQYSEYCRTKHNGLPIVIGDKVKKFCEYKEFRESLEHYVHLWDSMLRSGDTDIRLFHV